MKLLALAAVVLGFGILVGTRKETPFVRWGVILALAGVVLALSSAFFALGSIKIGFFLAVAGVAAYAFGRVIRKERLSIGTGVSPNPHRISKPK